MYQLRGDSREPIDGVVMDKIHVGLLTDFENQVENVRNLKVSNITWDAFGEADGEMSISGFAPGR